MLRVLLVFNDNVLNVSGLSKELINLGRNLKNDIRFDNMAVSNFDNE